MQTNGVANKRHGVVCLQQFYLPVLLLLFAGLALPAWAATKTWSGLAAGGNGNWSAGGNWTGGAPSIGDSLVFPVGAAKLNNTNDFVAGTVMGSITISGLNYVLNGTNSLTITNGISAQNATTTNTIFFPILFNGPNTIAVTLAGGTLAFNNSLTLNGPLTNSAVGNIRSQISLVGTGAVVKTGSGKLTITGLGASYLGTTYVNAGTVELNSAFFGPLISIPGNLVIGDGVSVATVRDLRSSQLTSSNITINANATLDLNGFNESTGPLTINSGTLMTGAGTNTLLAGLTGGSGVSGTAHISGKLSLGGTNQVFNILYGNASPDLAISAVIMDGGASAGITTTGLGYLALSGANTYSGVTTVGSNDLVLVQNPLALGAAGSPASGTVIQNGATLSISGEIVANEDLTLNLNSILASSTTASWSGPITLNDNAIETASGGSTLTNSGAISGPGGLTLNGGTFYLVGISGNTYEGPTTVNAGTVYLDKNSGVAIPSGSGPLTIGNGLTPGATVLNTVVGNNIGSDVNVILNPNGQLNLNGFNEHTGTLTFKGGSVLTGSGILNLYGDITGIANTNSTSVLLGNVTLQLTPNLNVGTSNTLSPDLIIGGTISGGFGLTKNGLGSVSFISSNSFSGPVVINAGTVILQNNFALGTTNSGTTLNGSGVLQLSSVQVTNESLTLNSTALNYNLGPSALTVTTGTNSWIGPITLANNTAIIVSNATALLNLGGSIGGPGKLDTWGLGTVAYVGTNANTYTNATTVNSGTLLLAKTIAASSILGPLNLSTVYPLFSAGKMAAVFQFGGTVPLTVGQNGSFDFNNLGGPLGSLSGAGPVTLGSAAPSFGNDNASTDFSGSVSGVSGFFKNGTGTMRLLGGLLIPAIAVNGGTLLVDSSAPNLVVITESLGTVGGSGAVGTINFDTGGTIMPGDSNHLTLTASNTITANPGNYIFHLNGPLAGTDYATEHVIRTNQLNGTLSVTLGFAPTLGQSFTLMQNTALSGTFTGLPEGSTPLYNGLPFKLSYLGGGGHDVTLTLTSVPAGAAAGYLSGNNGGGLLAADSCNNLLIAITNNSGGAFTAASATLTTTNSGVVISQPFASYPNIPAGARGTNLAPFQLTMLPGFICGTPVNLLLTLSNASFGPYVTALTIPTGGQTSAPVRFDNNTQVAMADISTNDILFNVGGFTGILSNVTAAVYITHPFDGDLSLYLIAPDSTTVRLASNDGSSSDDFGTFCGNGARTVFDDASAISIDSGSGPFTNTYHPQQPLAAFAGKTGNAVNGTWTLRIVDGFPSSVGVFRCASIFLSPVGCGGSSGACELCPNVTINGALDLNSPYEPNRLTRDGNASECGATVFCPGTTGPPPLTSLFYQAQTFRNGPQDACITVTLVAPTADLYSAAYAGHFDPNNICDTNLLGTSGDSTIFPNTIGLPPSPTRTYSFNVTANQVFDVVVNGIDGAYGPYQLIVTGGSCQPSLQVNRATTNKVRLDWPTSAGGYVLEATPSLTVTNWSGVTNPPVVNGGRYIVTNNAAAPGSFYRLHKP